MCQGPYDAAAKLLEPSSTSSPQLSLVKHRAAPCSITRVIRGGSVGRLIGYRDYTIMPEGTHA